MVIRLAEHSLDKSQNLLSSFPNSYLEPTDLSTKNFNAEKIRWVFLQLFNNVFGVKQLIYTFNTWTQLNLIELLWKFVVKQSARKVEVDPSILSKSLI